MSWLVDAKIKQALDKGSNGTIWNPVNKHIWIYTSSGNLGTQYREYHCKCGVRVRLIRCKNEYGVRVYLSYRISECEKIMQSCDENIMDRALK